jgi:hypothetical protein
LRPGAWTWRRAIGLIVVLNLLLGLGLFAIRSPWRQPPEAIVPPVLPPQIQQLQHRVQTGAAGESYDLTLTDAELTAAAAYYVATQPDVPFDRVQVAVANDKITVNAVTKGLAVAAPVRVIGTFSASGGIPYTSLEDVSLGDVGLPAFARDRIVAEANRSLDFSRKDLPVTVESVDLRAGGLTIRGHVK